MSPEQHNPIAQQVQDRHGPVEPTTPTSWPAFNVPDRVLSSDEEREALAVFIDECKRVGIPLEDEALRRRARAMLRRHKKAKRAGVRVA